MRILFIGGTGLISTAASRAVLAAGHELYLLNRGIRVAGLPGAHILTADVSRPNHARAAIEDLDFDVVVGWIAFTPDDIERDLVLFAGRIRQYVFISSASAYQKPPARYVITEQTRSRTRSGSTPATRSRARSA